ncbi:MAG: hypothetical protein P8Q50_15005 [Octadecabacter sp.]|nr:hypothetical protein [Octadecabacter sp.]
MSGFTQKALRDWKRSHVGHRSFTVIRHPVARAHAAFCDKILPTGEGSYVGIRKMLSQQFKLNLPSKILMVDILTLITNRRSSDF